MKPTLPTPGLCLSACLALLTCPAAPASAQQSSDAVRWSTWAALQAVPSPALFSDNGGGMSRVVFGLRWHLTPINYSFSANRLVNPIQVLFVNPVRRYGGSAELFVDPQWALDSYRYSGAERFAVATGVRAYLAVDEYGEYLAVSVGGQYLLRQAVDGKDDARWGAEAGVHTLFGLVGLRGCWYPGAPGGYSIAFTLRYY